MPSKCESCEQLLDALTDTQEELSDVTADLVAFTERLRAAELEGLKAHIALNEVYGPSGGSIADRIRALAAHHAKKSISDLDKPTPKSRRRMRRWTW